MKIFVVGANGQIDRYLIGDLAPSFREIFTGVRDAASRTLVKKENVSYVSFDLIWSVEKMTEAFKGIDVLVLAADSQGKNLLQVDLDGAIKTVIAAENAHVSCYLMVSVVHADEPAKWPESMTDCYITKHYADEWLEQTNLSFVILQPVILTNDEEVTSIRLTKPNEKASKMITRSTVVAVFAALVEETDISRTALVLSEGNKELNTVFQEWAKGEQIHACHLDQAS